MSFHFIKAYTQVILIEFLYYHQQLQAYGAEVKVILE